jgi:4-diphosphocytidyl-2-C-methyl-D-erythritol kinase
MKKTAMAHAKVNLYLKVTGKRDDGYHLIRSFFQKISLADQLTFTSIDESRIKIRCDHPDVPLDESNLVAKAAKALLDFTGSDNGAEIDIIKRIPIAAGLGGGSSDAAATLVVLNDLWELGLDRDELLSLALGLGADVPFFLGDYPAAWVEGIGEKIRAVSVDRAFGMVLFKPAFPIYAGSAFSGSEFDFESGPEGESVITKLTSADPANVADMMKNDLQPWAFKTHPKLVGLNDAIRNSDNPRITVVMTGSGPTLMALYENNDAARRASEELSGLAEYVEAVTTLV